VTWRFYRALLAKDRQNPDLLFLRGKALLYGGSTDQALKHYQVAEALLCPCVAWRIEALLPRLLRSSS
jgi:hypothetical protein